MRLGGGGRKLKSIFSSCSTDKVRRTEGGRGCGARGRKVRDLPRNWCFRRRRWLRGAGGRGRAYILYLYNNNSSAGEGSMKMGGGKERRQKGRCGIIMFHYFHLFLSLSLSLPFLPLPPSHCLSHLLYLAPFVFSNSLPPPHNTLFVTLAPSLFLFLLLLYLFPHYRTLSHFSLWLELSWLFREIVLPLAQVDI